MKSGGAQRVASRLIFHWHELGVNLTLFTQAPPDLDFFELPNAVERIVVGGQKNSSNVFFGLIRNFGRIFTLRKAIKASGVDSVIAFIGQTAILTVIATRGLPIKVIISERNDPALQSLGKPWDTMRRFFYPMADVVTANTSGALETMKSYVPAEKLFLTPNPGPEPSVTWGSKSQNPMFLAVGRLSHQKGFDVLLDAFASLTQLIPEWRLTFLGEGELENSLVAQTKRLGLADKVIWAGLVKNPDAWYVSAEVFILPSRYEGTPNAMLEAMEAGLPIITSDASPGPLEFAKDEINALVVPKEDPDMLAKAMFRLAKNKRLRTYLGNNGRSRVLQHRPDEVWPLWDQLLQ